MSAETDSQSRDGPSRESWILRLRFWHLMVVLCVVLTLHAVGSYLSLGMWKVEQDEEGVVLRFGKVRYVAPPGIHFTLPWPIETMEIVGTREVRQVPVGFRFIDLALKFGLEGDDHQRALTPLIIRHADGGGLQHGLVLA